jgi:hypothetical protein
MNKFLIDDIRTPQAIDEKVMTELFPKFNETPEEIKKRSNAWIVLHNGVTPDGWTYQVIIQDVPSMSNVFYHIFIFGLDGSLLTHLPVKAAQPFPPVAEKREGWDYFDWMLIQGTLASYLTSVGMRPIEVDSKQEGKLAYSTKETPEEIADKISKGEPYTILVLPIETFFQKLEEYKKKLEDEKPRIITP